MAKKEKEEAPRREMMEVFQEVLDALHTSAGEAPPIETADVDQTIADLEHNLEELRSKAEELYKATGMSKEQLEEFSSNPNNFSKEEWEMLEKIRAELRGMQEEAEEAFAEATRTEETAVEEKKEAAKRAKRAGRAKKKKWLQG